MSDGKQAAEEYEEEAHGGVDHSADRFESMIVVLKFLVVEKDG